MRPRSRERGIALITVLWVILLLSALMAASTYVTRTQAVLVRRAYDVGRAQAATDAAVIDTISRIGGSDPKDAKSASASSRRWTFEGYDIEIRVSREASRIDLNSSDPVLVKAYLATQGIEQTKADALVESMLRYENRAGTNQPSNAIQRKLKTLRDMQQVPGWADTPAGCEEEDLTVYSSSSTVEPSERTGGVKAALEWATAQDHGLIPAPSDTPAPLLGDIVRVSARIEDVESTNTASTMGTRWIGRITGDSAHPMLTLLWDHALGSACRVH